MRDCQSSMAAVRPADLKYNNRRQILELFKTGAVRSVAEIARAVGISRQTVMKAVQFYLEKGIVVSEGKAASSSVGGKRAELFRLSGDLYLMSMVFSPNCIHVSMLNFRGEVLDSCTRSDVSIQDIDAIVSMAGEACRAMIDKRGIPMNCVKGVCVVLPGIINQQTNRLRFNAFFPSWGKNVPIAEKLAKYFEPDTLIVTENIAKVCGNAYRYDERMSRGYVATLFSGWGGVSASLMSHGRMLSGRGYLIGEIGHMAIAPDDDELCGCGCKGCFERQVSSARLQRIIREHAAEYPESTLLEKPVDEIAIRDVFEASRNGDALGRMLSGYAARCFSLALRNLMLVFNPDCVVFQGDYACIDAHFRSELFRELHHFRGLETAESEDSPFVLEVDGRSTRELAMLGVYTILIDRIFSDREVYL